MSKFNQSCVGFGAAGDYAVGDSNGALGEIRHLLLLPGPARYSVVGRCEGEWNTLDLV